MTVAGIYDQRATAALFALQDRQLILKTSGQRSHTGTTVGL